MTKLYIIILCLFSFSSFGQLIEDDSYLDQKFTVFKAKLTLAIENKDGAMLSSLMADTIFGVKDDCGINGCSQEMFFKYSFDTTRSEGWEELAQIVRFGFKRKSRNLPYHLISDEQIVFQAPSYLDKFNYEKTLLILGEKVNIRKSPSIKSEIIARISYDTVSCKCGTTNMTKESFVENDNIRWVRIRLNNGQVGYVAESLTSNIISTEITVAFINGEWKIKSISPTMYC